MNLRDPLFKGCTRPAMVMGVPMVPFCLVIGTIVLLSIYISLLIMGLAIPAVLIMRLVVKNDDQAFRLFYLKWMMKSQVSMYSLKFWKSSAYSPISFNIGKRDNEK